MQTEDEVRAAIVAEALSFVGTAFHNRGRIKCKRNAEGKIIDKGGVDCAQFPYLVYYNLGLIPELPAPVYSEQWFLNRKEERFLEIVKGFSKEIEYPKAGDFVLYKWGHTFAHGAIIVTWPHIIHAFKPAGGVLLDLGDQATLAGREHKFFSMIKDAL